MFAPVLGQAERSGWIIFILQVLDSMYSAGMQYLVSSIQGEFLGVLIGAVLTVQGRIAERLDTIGTWLICHEDI